MKLLSILLLWLVIKTTSMKQLLEKKITPNPFNLFNDYLVRIGCILFSPATAIENKDFLLYILSE